MSLVRRLPALAMLLVWSMCWIGLWSAVAEDQPAPQPAQADPQQSQFRRVAEKLEAKLKELAVKQCSFGNISPATGNSEFGKRFVREVGAQLGQLTIQVVKNAEINVTGSFQLIVPEDEPPKVTFLLNLVRRNQIQPESTLDVTIDFSADAPPRDATPPAEEEPAERRRDKTPPKEPRPKPPGPKSDVTDAMAEESLLSAGISTSCSPKLELFERRQKIQQLIDEAADRTEIIQLKYRDPNGKSVTEPVARVKGGMGYAIQVRSNQQPLRLSLMKAPINDQPVGFVPMNLGTTYVIRIINPLKFDSVARVEIDQVNVFRYFESAGAPRFFVVPAGQSIDVPGWVTSLGQSREFLITTFEDSARAKEGLEPPGDGLGLISVSFRHSWTQTPPPDEGSARSGTQGADNRPDLTGLGKPIQRDYVVVSQHVGFLSDVIHLRYGKTQESLAKARSALVTKTDDR